VIVTEYFYMTAKASKYFVDKRLSKIQCGGETFKDTGRQNC